MLESRVLTRYKGREELYCSITNMKCPVSSAKSNRPTPRSRQRVCRLHCPYDMKWQSRRADYID